MSPAMTIVFAVRRCRGDRQPGGKASPSALFFLLALASVGCGPIQPKLAYDPKPLAPPAPEEAWPAREALRIPGGQATLDAAPAAIRQSLAVGAEPGLEHFAGGVVADLPALIDLAQRLNPETRAGWEQARAAASRLGIAEGAYLPTLGAFTIADYTKVVAANKVEAFPLIVGRVLPGLELKWLLLDFGRRSAEVEGAAQSLLAANLQFNRRHQQVTYDVQKGYYALDAGRARVTAREVALKAAIAVEDAVEIRGRTGLATATDLLLARQARLQQDFDLAAARRDVRVAEADLATAVGVSPAALPETASLADLPLPTTLPEKVEALLAQALAARPDLAAKYAEARAYEAELRRARADYLPKLSAKGALARLFRQVDSPSAERNGLTFGTNQTEWGVGIELTWQIFDGFIRDNRISEAKAKLEAANADLKAVTLDTMREAWTAYASLQASLIQFEFADALVATTSEAYQAALTGYTSGITNFLDLLAAERDYARALSVRVDTRAAILANAAALAFAVGTTVL